MADDDNNSRKGHGDDEIKALLVREIAAARANDDAAEAKARRDALNYYNGDISDDLPAETGRSSVVSRDLSDAVGWVLPQILRVLTATPRGRARRPTASTTSSTRTTPATGSSVTPRGTRWC